MLIAHALYTEIGGPVGLSSGVARLASAVTAVRRRDGCYHGFYTRCLR
jgi:hypothetical protein